MKSLRHIMAERYEIVIDFAKYNPGTKIVLRNTNPPNNTAFPNIDKIMQFDVTDETFDPTDNEVPASLFPENEVMSAAAERVGRPPHDGAEARRTASGR